MRVLSLLGIVSAHVEDSVHAAGRFHGLIVSNIYWYRDGLDAWHDAQYALAQSPP